MSTQRGTRISFQKQGRFFRCLLSEIETGVQDGNLEAFVENAFSKTGSSHA